jgi:hypothetical protein
MSWRDQAQCAGVDPYRFFADPHDQKTRISTIKYCQTCPVMIECRTESIKIELEDGIQIHGIWGGMAREARLRWARQQGLTR